MNRRKRCERCGSLSCAEARAAGYSCTDAKTIGYDLIDAKAAGWTTRKSCSAAECMTETLNAGYINQALAMRLDAADSEAAKI